MVFLKLVILVVFLVGEGRERAFKSAVVRGRERERERERGENERGRARE